MSGDVYLSFDLIVKLLEEIHSISQPLKIECKDYWIHHCENLSDKDGFLFLPYELEFLSEKQTEPDLRISDLTINNIKTGYMPKGISCCRYAEKKKINPFDYTGYPLFPYFSKSGEIMFYISLKCPFNGELDNSFIRSIMQCWYIANRFITLEWKEYYNSLCAYDERNLVNTDGILED